MRLQGEALLGHAVRHAIAIVILVAGARHAPIALLGALALRAGGNRAWLLAETLAAMAFTTLALISRTTLGAAWVLVNVVLQLTASAWASNLPHRPPALFVKIARHLEWTHSAVVASFLHHELHHRFPSLPLPASDRAGWMSRRNQEHPA